MAKAKKAGIQPFAFGDLRKKAATDMKNQSGQQLAANLLGHSSETVTKAHYISDEEIIKTKPLK